jgi:hypothetical protein
MLTFSSYGDDDDYGYSGGSSYKKFVKDFRTETSIMYSFFLEMVTSKIATNQKPIKTIIQIITITMMMITLRTTVKNVNMV